MTKFLIDCENTMTMCAVNKLKGHTGRAFLGILHTASRAEAAFAAEGNKFHVVASGADIQGTAKRRIATIQHFIDIFHLRISGMKSVFDYFIMVIKDFLQDIHNVIMREREEKRKPHPSRLRGRGVEVSKTLFRFRSQSPWWGRVLSWMPEKQAPWRSWRRVQSQNALIFFLGKKIVNF